MNPIKPRITLCMVHLDKIKHYRYVYSITGALANMNLPIQTCFILLVAWCSHVLFCNESSASVNMVKYNNRVKNNYRGTYHDLCITGTAYQNGMKLPWKERYKDKTDPLFRYLSEDICLSIHNAFIPNTTLAAAWAVCELERAKNGSTIAMVHVYLTKDRLVEHHVKFGNRHFFRTVKQLLTNYTRKPVSGLIYFGIIKSVKAHGSCLSITKWCITIPTIAIILIHYLERH
ncbi:hypothetical protein EG68_00958 [Paragonimus skrjabini miyazakii]|uniref:Uncharacterized protein n=1 Tax=Paragonimus skrjabini miyazakii TaxID=59628 RepID=A0A8S9Z9A8_9TREM|nr:hypothetical protein EG68_00958 [Paragonimus skrjabini miyazakii]